MNILLNFLFILLIMMSSDSSIYSYDVKNIDGKEMTLSEYKGKVLLIVNVASKCGYTPQYEGLQALYEKYGDQGLVVLGFPANNFRGQEPGSNEEIKQFCTVNYDATFPMMSKVSVLGEDQHPLFSYLTTAENPDFKGDIKWNFEKFLVDAEGNLVHRFRSGEKPESEKIIGAIESALSK